MGGNGTGIVSEDWELVNGKMRKGMESAYPTSLSGDEMWMWRLWQMLIGGMQWNHLVCTEWMKQNDGCEQQQLHKGITAIL